MNYLVLEKTIYNASKSGNYILIRQILKDISENKKKLDLWFDKFINIFDEKLGSEDCISSDPIKRLYNYKFHEYQSINHVISIAKYHLGKMYV
jgi:hypothetical protein